jgi:hypothetical protein
MEAMTGVLPGGYWDSTGVLHREFELGVLTGREEELLAQTRRSESASLVTMVLSRCVRRLGKISPLPEEVTRQLLVADRQYLLLKLRQSTFGDTVRASVFCPWPDCGKRVSLEFGIGDVPVEETTEPAPLYRMTLSAGASPESNPEEREITFRLPNGTDQETVSPLLAHNEAEALSRLLDRSIQQIGPHSPPGEERIAALSPAARAEIEAEMERVAPKVELTMDTTCSECGRDFAVPFELERFFFGELRTDSELLYRQIHYLAFHYHWGEGEIMAMPRDKRQTYIGLLADEIERLNNRED